MSSDALPPLPADLRWLIDMEPTQDALDNYLAGRPSAKVGPEAHRNPFSISNIFASPKEAPSLQRTYDIVRNGCLADAPDSRFPLYAYQDNPEAEAAIEKMRQNHMTSGFSGDPPIPYEEMRKRQRSTHDLPIHQLCSDLLREWEGVFLPTDVSRMPTMALIHDLYKQHAAAHLILLTARHELGTLYVKATMWGERAKKREYTNSNDVALSRNDLGRLSARARGHRYWDIGESINLSQDKGDWEKRTDAPTQYLIPSSDLADLYWQFYNWYCSIYREIVKGPECKGPGGGKKCPYHRRLILKQGRGTKPGRCADCKSAVERAQSRVRVTRFRAPKDGVVENVTLRYD